MLPSSAAASSSFVARSFIDVVCSHLAALIDWRKISAFINNNNFYSPFAAVAVVVSVCAECVQCIL